jgi:hypothetical protein
LNAERDTYELRQDPTYLTEISQKYQQIVETIFEYDDSELLEQIDSGIIADFRDRHGGAAFPCRYRFCARASNGYPTKQERNTHEISHHPRIKCPKLSCEFHHYGFASESALDRHNIHHHQNQDLAASPSPRLIRKTFDLTLRKRFIESDTASAPNLNLKQEPEKDLPIEDDVDHDMDLDEPRSCFCNRVDSGTMIGCENPDVCTTFLRDESCRNPFPQYKGWRLEESKSNL